MAGDVETLDCGDNSCLYATKRGGMRTNGGCRCSLKIRYFGGDQEIELHVIRRALRRHGLDICTAADRKVLEACAAAEIETVGGRNRSRRLFAFELQESAICDAELARRGGTRG